MKSGLAVVCLALVLALASSARAAAIHGLPIPVVWPQPQTMSNGTDTLILPTTFTIVSQASNDILKAALGRYTKIVLDTHYNHFVMAYPARIRVATATGQLNQLTVKLIDANDTNLKLGVDESYSLVINSKGATLTANKVWGALRGLETFTQLVQWNGTARIVRFTPISITDAPRYPWRGLLLDTARHFFPVSTIKRVIDILAAIKMNVFHWHITDAEAFPLQLRSRPLLSQLGAWSPDARYSAKDVVEIVRYATLRGVRVVPEFDTPGHTYSWGAAYPDIILNCTKVISKGSSPNVNNACFDMTNPNTYTVVNDVITEVSTLFPDSYLHLGGDEVAFSCVDEFPRIKEWMRQNGLNASNYADLTQYYTLKLASIVNNVNKDMVMWQEAFYNAEKNPSNPRPLPQGTIFHIWKNEGLKSTLTDLLTANMPTLVSSGWYLDQQVPSPNGTTHYLWQDTFLDFWNNEIEAGLDAFNATQLKLILGGEACQWGEQVDGTALWARIMPRAAATAERLWSPKYNGAQSDALKRIIIARCRYAQRGFEPSGIRPDYCEIPPTASN